MIKIDSLKLLVPFDAVRKIYKEKFLTKIVIDENGKRNKKLFSNKSILGLKYIEVDLIRKEIIIEISSKILKEKYPSLINVITIERAIYNLEQYGFLEFNFNKFIDTASVLNFDVSRNLKMKHPPEVYLRDLKLFPINSIYNSVLRRGRLIISSKSLRLILYNKYEEFQANKKSNKELKKYVNTEIFKNVLRIESSFRTFKKMRTEFSISNNDRVSLMDILSCKSNILLNNFNHVFKQDKNEMFERKSELIKSDLSVSEIEKKLGRKEIVKLFGYDLNEVKLFVQGKVKGNIYSRYMPNYKKSIRSSLCSKLDYYENINEIRHKLENFLSPAKKY